MSTSITKLVLAALLLIGGFGSALAQEIVQTVRGKVVDSDSELPLIGAVVFLENSDPIIGATTDVNGNFRLDGIPLGRISLQLSYIGYEPLRIPNVERRTLSWRCAPLPLCTVVHVAN